MDKVLVDIRDENKWIKRHLPEKDMVSVDELLNAIEDMDDEISNLKEMIDDLEGEIDEYRKNFNDQIDTYYYTGERNA